MLNIIHFFIIFDLLFTPLLFLKTHFAVNFFSAGSDTFLHFALVQQHLKSQTKLDPGLDYVSILVFLHGLVLALN